MQDPALIQNAAENLARGELVAFPTETVYGLGADARNPTAIEKVFDAKGRPATNPLIVHVDGEPMARTITRTWPDAAHKIAGAFWPGPISIILPKASSIPAIVTAGGDTVAVRCPNHSIALSLIRTFGGPLVAPSANRSGSISPTTAQHVAASFPDLTILDGGSCTQGIESTVLSLVHPVPTILRPGNISQQQLSEVLGQSVAVRAISQDSNGESAPSSPALSPGTHHSHYAPSSPVTLYRVGEFEAIAASVDGPIIALVITDQPALLPPSRVEVMPGNPIDYARALYAALHDADSEQPALIAIELPVEQNDATWHAILDRLRRAAAPRD